MQFVDRVDSSGKAVIETNGQPARDMVPPDLVVPVYVGVGMRVIASVSVRGGNVVLSNLPALGAAVSSGAAYGTLAIQTLGLSGESVSGAIPIPSELNETTIQNALMAMGAIKAKTYHEATFVTPRVVGFHNYGMDEVQVNLVVSAINELPLMVPSYIGARRPQWDGRVDPPRSGGTSEPLPVRPGQHQ